jgi:hypothetical protein
MNPHNLSASDLMIWGLVAHLVADWPLQNDWMAKNKMKVLHPAGYVHAAIHAFFLSLVFGWAGFFIAFAHLLIDFRKPVQWWSKFVRQTQPKNQVYYQRWSIDNIEEIPVYDIGLEVRFWTDQVFHIICIAIAALLITWPS